MDETKLIKENIEKYLVQHQRKELLRFVTVGSVDDGKSTLIGRLLHDTESVYIDQLDSARRSTKQRVGTEIDFSLLTDGLKAEREQGITIDVAYRYFTTEKRKFIIADTPGHVQYTRNMATGASTADVAIILIDANLGVLPQSKRHAFIARLLGISHLIIAINKMDLKNYDKKVFESIRNDFENFAKDLKFTECAYFPISALKGDNIVSQSKNTPWYKGPSILHYLETVPIPKQTNFEDFFLPVQYVIRPDLNFRGFSGQIASGVVHPGDEIMVLPSEKCSFVKSIVTYDGKLQEAYPPMSVTLTLKDEIDVSRGNFIVHKKNNFNVSQTLYAYLVWMNEKPLKPGGQYYIKHTTNTITGVINRVDDIVDVETLENVKAKTLNLNDIGRVQITLSRPIACRRYTKNRQAGAFIVIDRLTHETVGSGMIIDCDKSDSIDTKTLAEGLTIEERGKRFNQNPCLITLTGKPGTAKIILARALERRLFDTGYEPVALIPEEGQLTHIDRNATGDNLRAIGDAISLYLEVGMIILCPYTLPTQSDRDSLFNKATHASQIEIYTKADLKASKERLARLGRNEKNAQLKYEEPSNPDLTIDTTELDVGKTVEQIISLLRDKGILK